ncbi:MAG TPA: hypothetical protein VNY31_04835 [Solirubrobacteraceae bacterium]|nr:hypothetical protein [Solirubrobacteraceae bacterium]
MRRIAAATLDLGDGVGFRVLIQKGRAVGSSGEVQLRYAAVGVWEDGKIVRMTNSTTSTRPVLPPNALPRSGPMAEEAATLADLANASEHG